MECEVHHKTDFRQVRERSEVQSQEHGFSCVDVGRENEGTKVPWSEKIRILNGKTCVKLIPNHHGKRDRERRPAFLPVTTFIGFCQIPRVYIPPLVHNLHNEFIPLLKVPVKNHLAATGIERIIIRTRAELFTPQKADWWQWRRREAKVDSEQRAVISPGSTEVGESFGMDLGVWGANSNLSTEFYKPLRFKTGADQSPVVKEEAMVLTIWSWEEELTINGCIARSLLKLHSLPRGMLVRLDAEEVGWERKG
ncbi:hypothetical protein BTVI_132006 [Pitangus sulphuratus]|nr:hypothetical protein BTVI_132006 [Pitangus sulphuratus]